MNETWPSVQLKYGRQQSFTVQVLSGFSQHKLHTGSYPVCNKC